MSLHDCSPVLAVDVDEVQNVNGYGHHNEQVVSDWVVIDHEADQVRRGGEVVLVLEVDHYWEAEGYEIDHKGVVEQVLSREEGRGLVDDGEVIEPDAGPGYFTQVEGVVIEAFEWTVEVCLCLTINF